MTKRPRLLKVSFAHRQNPSESFQILPNPLRYGIKKCPVMKHPSALLLMLFRLNDSFPNLQDPMQQCLVTTLTTLINSLQISLLGLDLFQEVQCALRFHGAHNLSGKIMVKREERQRDGSPRKNDADWCHTDTTTLG